MGNIGGIIKQIRLEKNMTQKELSEKSGIAEITIRKLENDASRNPSIGTVKKLADALDVPYVDLLDVDSEEFKQFKENRKYFAKVLNSHYANYVYDALYDKLKDLNPTDLEYVSLFVEAIRKKRNEDK